MSALTPIAVELPQQTDPRPDEQLIADINGGDAAAFDVLYFRHRDWVLSLAVRLTGSDDLALDVMQETFLYLLHKFPGFRLTAQLKTFLYPAVRNLSIAARKKAGRYQSTASEHHFLEQIPADTAAASHLGDLASALANLSSEHREVLMLRFVDDLSLAEIAEAMEIPLGTVKSRMHHALEFLRQDSRAKQFFEP